MSLISCSSETSPEYKFPGFAEVRINIADISGSEAKRGFGALNAP